MQEVYHDFLHKSTILFIIHIDCWRSAGNRERTILTMLGRLSLKIYLLNGIFLKPLRRAGILVAELKCCFFDTSCNGTRKSAPKSTVGKNCGRTFYYNALRSWLIKVGIKTYLYNICYCNAFIVYARAFLGISTLRTWLVNVPVALLFPTVNFSVSKIFKWVFLSKHWHEVDEPTTL